MRYSEIHNFQLFTQIIKGKFDNLVLFQMNTELQGSKFYFEIIPQLRKVEFKAGELIYKAGDQALECEF